MDIQGFHAVSPIRNCPHSIDENIAPIERFKERSVSEKCGECNEGFENWVCLQCATIFCSR